MTYTQQDILNYLQKEGLPLNAYGINQAIQRFNASGAGTVTLNDVGAAFGLNPEQTQQWMEANPGSFTDAFGGDAKLFRQSVGANAANPFYVDSTGNGSIGIGALSQQDSSKANDGTWKFNPATNNFEFLPGGYLSKGTPTKTFSASDLGLTDPAYQISGLASLAGRNGDSWSNYALTHNNYGGGVGSKQSMLNGASDLRNKIGDINGYEAPSKFDTFMDKNGWMLPIALVTAGAALGGTGSTAASLASKAVVAEQTAAPILDAVMTPVAGAGGGTAVGTGGGVLGGIGVGSGVAGLGMGTGVAGIPGAGAAAGTISGVTPSLFTAGELASTFPGAYGAGAGAGAAAGLGGVLGGANAVATGSSILDKLTSGSGIASLAGGLLGGLSGGAKQAGVTTTTQTPWEPMQPYLIDAANAAKSNYDDTRKLSPQQQSVLDQALQIASGQMGDPRLQGLKDWAENVFTGNSNAFSPVGNISGVQSITAQQVDPFGFKSAGAPQITVGGAFDRMGGVNPTQAYQSLLSGNVTNPYLSNIAQDNYTMANRNLMENIMPGIGSGASASGQYGGSRQGIAQGLAISRMNQDVTQANNQMFGNAYQHAQGNMLSAAGQLGILGMGAETQNAANTLNNNQFNSSLSSGIAQNNANRAFSADSANAANALNTQQFNANLGLQNNSQRLGQMNSAVDWFNNANNMQNTAIKNSLDLGNYQNTHANDALNTYGSLIGKFGGMGGQASQPYYTNPTNNMLGGAIAGANLYKNIFG